MNADGPNVTRRNRILGLIGLGLVAALFFAATVFCARVASGAESEAIRSRGEHLAITWLVAFGICGGAWIWLLIKTIRGDEDDGYVE